MHPLALWFLCLVLLLLGACSDNATAPETVGEISISPPAATIELPGELQLEATVRSTEGRVLDDREVTWTTDEPDVATVSSEGLVTTANTPGAAQITARSEGQQGAALITVEMVPVAAIEIHAERDTILVWDELTFGATVMDASGRELEGRVLSWATSDRDVATIDSSGVLTAHGSGEVAVSASSGGHSASRSLTVRERPAASIEVGPEFASIDVDESIEMWTVVRDDQGRELEGRPVQWGVSESDVAQVEADGRVTGLLPGVVEVTASVEEVRDSQSLTIRSNLGIAEADHATIEAALVEIAETGEWYPAHYALMDVLRIGYSVEQWWGFFDAYLDEPGRLTPEAVSYLRYLSWILSDPWGAAFLEGFLGSLTGRVWSRVGLPPEHEESAPANPYVDHIFWTKAVFLRDVDGIAAASVRGTVREMIETMRTPILDLDLGAMESVGLRAWLGTIYLDSFSRAERTSARREEIVRELRLLPGPARILRDFGVLVADFCRDYGTINCGRIDEGGIDAIHSVLGGVDRSLYRDHLIVIANAPVIVTSDPEFCCYYSGRGPTVSIGNPGNDVVEDPFTSDAEPWVVPWFSTVLHHEFAHEIDNYLYSTDGEYKEMRDRLIADAGTDPMQYLRGDVDHGPGFFVERPVELFSSLSQQYLANSENTFRHGIGRFHDGYTEPLRQALWLAEVYSVGADTAPIYTTDAQGITSRLDAPVVRAANGQIVRIEIEGRVYEFEREAGGAVVSVDHP